MSEGIRSLKVFFLEIKFSFFITLFTILFSGVAFSQSMDDTLLIVNDRIITRGEFLYHFQKSNQEINKQNITEFLEQYINFQLKLADARGEGFQHDIAFINELTEYRLMLAAPYLTDKEKEVHENAESKNEKAENTEDSFIEKLKKYWNFKENLCALEIICNLADERVYNGNWIAPVNQSFDDTLFIIDGKKTDQNDFIDFMQDFKAKNKDLSVRDYIISLYKQFVSKRLLQYENYKLNDKYPEFRYQYEEYRDAILLDQITKKRVWLKAESDVKGMEEFFAENRENYKLKESLKGIIVTCANMKAAKLISRKVSKSLNFKGEEIHEVLSQIKNEAGSPEFIADEGVFLKGDTPLIDQIKWKQGVSGIKKSKDKYYFVIVENISEQKYQNLADVSDRVLNDYQNYLMDNWIQELKSRFKVQINKEVLSSIK